MRRRLPLLALLLAAPLAAVAGCGGGDDEDVRALLDRAFDQPIESAVVTADVEIELEGLQGVEGPLRLKLSGPYRSAEDKLPAFDWDVSFSGGGQNLTAELVSTSDNVFVGFRGTNYEVGEEDVSRFNEQLAAAQREEGERSLAQFGVDAREWLEDPEDAGDEEIAGVQTTHVTAGVDVGKMLADLNKVIERAGGAVPGQPPAQLTEEQREQVEEIVQEPTLDVYVGKEDSTVRRLAVNLEVEVPEGERDQVGGLERGAVSFSIEFARVGQEVRIEPPESARPIEELAEQIAGAGALGGGQAGGAQNGGGGQDGGGNGAGQNGAGDGAGQGDAQTTLQRYLSCVREADPGDLEAIQACEELLR